MPLDVQIRFRQPLPPGYRIMWWDGYEMYGWENASDCSELFCDRWMAYRDAWAHYRRLHVLNTELPAGKSIPPSFAELNK